jgi:hypothetical protein
MKYNPDLHNRYSILLRGYNYANIMARQHSPQKGQPRWVPFIAATPAGTNFGSYSNFDSEELYEDWGVPYCVASPSNTETSTVYLIYIDKDVTINGSNSYTPGPGTISMVFDNVSLTQGWNILISDYSIDGNDDHTETFTATKTWNNAWKWSMYPDD